MASVAVRDLVKRFPGGTLANDHVSLDIEDGEFMVLVGPSGCGKSTLLRMIAGLETPTSGEIRIQGRSVVDREPRERDVAMVFQNYALYPHMTVRKNLAFPLRMMRRPRAETDERVLEVARLLGLAPLLDRRPRQLSGGQMQRVALGRALVRNPSVFLFDEPLSNVDAKLRAEMRAELKALHSRLGTTMIYVTHDQVEAMTLGTRIAVLHEGRLQQVGPPLELYHRPRNRFVAAFLGSPPMNVVEHEAARMLRPAGAPEGCAVGFRPEDARQSGELEAEVLLAEALGATSLVHAQVGRDTFVMALPGDPPSGATMRWDVPREALHLFDARTGERLDRD